MAVDTTAVIAAAQDLADAQASLDTAIAATSAARDAYTAAVDAVHDAEDDEASLRDAVQAKQVALLVAATA